MKKYQLKTNVNQKLMSTKTKCQPKKKFNQKQISTKNKCQPWAPLSTIVNHVVNQFNQMHYRLQNQGLPWG